MRELLLPQAPTRRFWLALIGVALALRAVVGLGLLGGMPIVSDAFAYSDQASDILDGEDDYAYFWPPGTSYVLAAAYAVFGEHDWAARVAMVLVSVLAVVVTTLLALRLAREPRPAMLTGWILALYPGMWMQVVQPFSFDLTLLFVSLTALFALRAWESSNPLDYLVAGLALGAAGLTRPSTLSIGLGLAVCAAVAIRRRRQRGEPTGLGRLVLGSALTGVVTLAVLGAALIHNQRQDQGWTLSVSNELNVWIGNNPYTPVYRTDQVGQHAIEDFPAEAQPYLTEFRYYDDPSREQRRVTLEEAQRYVEEHPAHTALRTANRARAFWGFDYTISELLHSEWGKSTKVEAVGLAFEAGGYAILMLLAIIGLVFARGLLRAGAVGYLIALIVAFAIPYLLVYAAGRWHYPVLGLLAVFAGAGAAWLTQTPDWWRQLRTSGTFWVALGLFVALQIEYAYFTATTPP
jgi:4-amino-4-deoxy-L-arabinose transferase-like glycosyltransferase